MQHQGTKQIETERLILRQFTQNDAEAMFNNWANDAEVTKFLVWQPHQSIDDSQDICNMWISSYKNLNFYQWAIVPKDLNEPIGSISVVSIAENINAVHTGYCIGKKWWNKGYTSEAYKRVIKFLFEDVKVNRIEATHDTENPNSGLVMKKCGLQFEGIARQGGLNNRGIIDHCVYSILAKDYFSK